MLKQVFLAHFELVVTRFGPWNIPKCLENGPLWDQKWVKNGSKTCFSKSDPGPVAMLKQMFLAHNFGKNHFFRPGDPGGPPLAPTVRGLYYPPAPPSDHWHGGLGVSLGDSEAWKPQKWGVAGGLGALGIRFRVGYDMTLIRILTRVLKIDIIVVQTPNTSPFHPKYQSKGHQNGQECVKNPQLLCHWLLL